MLGLALAGYLLVTGSAPLVDALLPMLAAATVALELTAVSLPVMGVFSPAAAVYLAAGAARGAQFAVLLCLFGLGIRTWQAGRPRATILDLCAVSTGLAVMEHLRGRGPAPMVAAAAYLLVTLALTRWFAEAHQEDELALFSRIFKELLPLWIGVASVAVALALLLPHGSWHLLWMAFPLWGLRLAAENTIYRLREREARGAIDRYHASRQTLQVARHQVIQTQKELKFTEEQKKLLEGFSKHLASDPSPEEVFAAIAATVKAVVPYRSLVLFSANDEGLWPWRFDSPESETLANAQLLKTREPLVEEVWSEGKPMVRMQEGQLLPSETVAVAFPLAREGVLYIGGTGSKSPSQKMTTRLAWIADKAALALASARRNAQQKKALEHHSRAHYALQERVKLLATLNSGSREIASTLDRPTILEALRNFLLVTVPHQHGAILLPQGPQVWDSSGRPFDRYQPQRFQALAQAVSQQTLVLPDLNDPKNKFAPPVDQARSLMCAPIRTREELLGHIVLLTDHPDSFSPEHRDLLATIATQAAVALNNEMHYHQVVEARRLLEESQAQLIQASKMTAIGQLAAGVAHEINTPLGVINMSLDAIDMALEAGKPDRAAKKINRAKRAVDQSRHIIERLLLYSRKSDDEKESFSSNQLVEDTIDFVSHYLDDGNFEVITEFGEVPELQGKPKDLQQVLVNLIMNAVDACSDLPPERRRIHLSTTRQPDCVSIKVKDWGPGMPPEVRARVFDPFFTTKEVGEGTGLGLSVSHQIVAQHQGSLSVDSEPGQGAVFDLRLPLN